MRWPTTNRRRTFIHRARLLATACLVLAAAHLAHAENWPQWRGPRGNSTSEDTGLPAVWNTETNIAWRTLLPDWGTSTPAIWDDAIFVTTQHDDELSLLKLNRQSGAVEWSQQVGRATTPRTGPKRQSQVFHQLHNLASPSPVTDGRLVAVHFGNGELAVYDFAGKLRWRRNLQDDYGRYTVWWGHANSPVIFGDLLISVCMQDSLADVADKPAPSYLVAHDLQSGKARWKSARMTGAPAEQGDAYTTPILAEVDGGLQLIVMGANHLDAYDPTSGRQLWYLPGLTGGRTVTGPTAAGGFIYVTRGMRGPLLAIRPGGKGQLGNDAIVWRYDQGTPDTPCPVVWNELVVTITDNGIAAAFDSLSGKLQWKERLKGDYKASPLAAEGRIYFLNTTGLCTVVSASPRFEKLAENQLPGDTLASPAAAGGHLYLRTRDALYCLGAKSSGSP